MKKTKLFFAGAAILIGGGTAVHAQSWRNGGAVSLDKQYADYPCVNLLDSTSVTVEPTGQGSFAVCRAVRVQTTAGALQQRVLKYDYDADGSRHLQASDHLPCRRNLYIGRCEQGLRLRRSSQSHLLGSPPDYAGTGCTATGRHHRL